MPKGNSSMTRTALRAMTMSVAAALLLSACGKDAGRPAAAAGSQHRHAEAARGRHHRPAARTHHRVSRRRSAPAGHGHRAEAPVRRRQEVKAGEQLFQIDSGSYRAALVSAQAALKRAEAQAVTAKLLDERYEPLIAANAVSRQENDEAIAARARADADVAAARAAGGRGAHQRGVHAGVVAHLRAHRPRAGHRRRAGHVRAGRRRWPHPAARSHLRRHHAVEHRDAAAAAPARERRAGEGRQEPGRGQRSRSRTAARMPERGTLKFSEVSVDPSTGSVVLRADVPESAPRAAARHVRARAARAGHASGGAAGAAARASRATRSGEATVLVVDAGQTRWPSAS